MGDARVYVCVRDIKHSHWPLCIYFINGSPVSVCIFNRHRVHSMLVRFAVYDHLLFYICTFSLSTDDAVCNVHGLPFQFYYLLRSLAGKPI